MKLSTSSRTRLHSFAVSLAALGLLLTTGCGGDPNAVNKVPVAGVATSAGSPVGGFSLSFVPDAGPATIAPVAEDGTFSTELVAGTAKVSVVVTGGGHDAANPKPPAGVAAKNVGPTSPLTVTIPEEGTDDLSVEVGS